MKLVLITTPVSTPKEIKRICQLFEQGLETLHLRKPYFSFEEMKGFIRDVPVQYHPRLMLHSQHGLAQEFQIKGLHFPETVRAEASAVPKQELLFSTSFHQLQEIERPQPPFDYAFLSPIYSGISKEGYTAAFAPEELEKAVQQAKISVVALGGVSADNLMDVQGKGFAGAAVLGAIWQAEEPVKAFQKLQRLVYG